MSCDTLWSICHILLKYNPSGHLFSDWSSIIYYSSLKYVFFRIMSLYPDLDSTLTMNVLSAQLSEAFLDMDVIHLSQIGFSPCTRSLDFDQIFTRKRCNVATISLFCKELLSSHKHGRPQVGSRQALATLGLSNIFKVIF